MSAPIERIQQRVLEEVRKQHYNYHIYSYNTPKIRVLLRDVGYDLSDISTSKEILHIFPHKITDTMDNDNPTTSYNDLVRLFIPEKILSIKSIYEQGG